MNTTFKLSDARPIASEADIAQVYSVLQSRPPLLGTTWNSRFRGLMARMESGSLLDLATVVRDLRAIRAEKDFSYGEVKMLDRALRLLAVEIASVRGQCEIMVEADLRARTAEISV